MGPAASQASHPKEDAETLAKREAKTLIMKIADRCEAAYRRGAQQAIAFGLSAEDASWYRYYGVRPNKEGYFRYQHALRMPEKGVDRIGKSFTGQQYSKAWKVPLTRAIEVKASGMIQKIAWAAKINLWDNVLPHRKNPGNAGTPQKIKSSHGHQS